MSDEQAKQEVFEIEPVTSVSALGAIDRAQLDSQIATARAYPRSVDAAIKQATTLATLDAETAGTMSYALKRGKKVIEGPSVHLARVMIHAWRNIRCEADVVGEDQNFVTAMGTCLDLENNTGVRVRVRRRITDRRGKRYNDDMIGVTSMAAISIAIRNAVFNVIPRPYVDRIYKQARTASLGDGTFSEKRKNALSWFEKEGITEDQLCKILDISGVDDMQEHHLVIARGLRTSLQDGETTVEQLLHADRVQTAAARQFNQRLACKACNGTGKTKDGDDCPDCAMGVPF